MVVECRNNNQNRFSIKLTRTIEFARTESAAFAVILAELSRNPVEGAGKLYEAEAPSFWLHVAAGSITH